MQEVYDSIFDVIKILEPDSDLYKCKQYHKETDLFRVMVPSDEYTWIERGDGTASPIRPTVSQIYYRGENNLYEECKPSYFRTKSESLKITSDIKAIEFELALKQFPQVYLAERDGMYIDYITLAQHYGIPTPHLDITQNLAVAAFFACYTFNSDGTCTPSENEYGQIRFAPLMYQNEFKPECPLHIFGLQPFMRPGRQYAAALRMTENEDFALKSTTYVFKHNKEDSEIIAAALSEVRDKEIIDKLWIFPCEHIVNVANTIKNRGYVSKDSVKLYCERRSEDYVSIKEILKDADCLISKKSTVWLSNGERNELEKQYRDYPYGNNRISARLRFRPIG